MSRGEESAWTRHSGYEQWIAAQHLPIHRGYSVEDVRTAEVGWWERRGCHTAFLALDGLDPVNEARLTELPGGATSRPARLAVDEVVYVVQGRGRASLTSGGKSRSIGLGPHDLFLIPRHALWQVSNPTDRPTRLLHYNALPLALTAVPDPEFLVDNEFDRDTLLIGRDGTDLYDGPRLTSGDGAGGNRGTYTWHGNWFPDLAAWDKLRSYGHRGAGRQVVWFNFPHTELWNHLSILASATYEKAHHRGVGPLMLILAGEGYSHYWPDGGEKVVVSWHEGSVTAPPDGWFHQHFNTGPDLVSYVGFHTPLNDREHVQIEYADEDPAVRHAFEAELERRGLTSRMPLELFPRLPERERVG